MDWVPEISIAARLDRRGALLSEQAHRKLYQGSKRAFDVAVSAMSLSLLCPVMLGIALVIRLSGRGGALYAHNRVGKDRREIPVLKFRTMVSDANNFDKYFTEEQKERFFLDFKLDDDPRVTKIGKWLRKTSLDELPQLINVLRGELSLVGPRPVVQREMDEYYGQTGHVLTSIRPGVTGYWQANGRSDTGYPKRVEMELHYARNCSWKMDIKILFQTVIVVLQRKGAK